MPLRLPGGRGVVRGGDAIATGFDERAYLAANPDVAAAVRNGHVRSGLDHYDRHGRTEGRALAPTRALSRQDKALWGADRKGRGLEVGPSINPIAPKRLGFDVQILDHLDAAGLRAKYRGQVSEAELQAIEDVDFVWAGQPLTELVGRTGCFDWIIASHVIEHVPDLIAFLQQCDALLAPDGVLSLVIPDKRYCFDHFLPPTFTGQLLDAWAQHRSCPSPGQVYDHLANASSRNGCIAWSAGGPGPDALAHTLDQARSLWIAYSAASVYADVHCWRFTPGSFGLLVHDFLALGLSALGIRAEFATAGCEFYVTLGRGCPPPSLDRIEALRRVQAESG